MGKQSGLGDNFYLGGYNVSGDINSLGRISSSQSAITKTDITKSAEARFDQGLKDGAIEFTSYFNDATGQAHAALSSLPTADLVATYFRGTTLGNPAASCIGKQIGYDGTRANEGSLLFAAQVQANGYGLEWGRSLTAGVRTDTAATNGTAIDTTASASFGGQAYLHVFGFSGTDVTVKIQDSADNVTFADIAGFSFTQILAFSHQNERIALGSTDTIRRYVRAVTVTTGGFTSLQFAVNMKKNEIAMVF